MKKPAILTVLTASLLTSFAAPVLAAPKLSAQSIIVNPVQTSLSARVWVDRDPSGTQSPNYRVGDRIRLFTQVNENAYVYLFNVNPDGSTDQILPNRLGGSNFVRKGEVRAFPAANDNFVFDVAGPYGLNKVLVIASRRPLNLSELSTFQAGQPFATVKPKSPERLAQALSIVVNPVTPTPAQPVVSQQDWVSDTVTYNVSY